jgi:hypothetical protein
MGAPVEEGSGIRLGRGSRIVLTLLWVFGWLYILQRVLGLIFLIGSPGASFHVPIPVVGFDATIPASVLPTGQDPFPTTGYYTGFEVSTSELSVSTRVWLWIGLVLTQLLHVAVALAIVNFGVLVLQGRPLVSRVSRYLVALSAALVVLGAGGAFATNWGTANARNELRLAGASGPLFSGGLPGPDLTVPLACAVVLGALAAVFRQAESLQRDTEGLV